MKHPAFDIMPTRRAGSRVAGRGVSRETPRGDGPRLAWSEGRFPIASIRPMPGNGPKMTIPQAAAGARLLAVGLVEPESPAALEYREEALGLNLTVGRIPRAAAIQERPLFGRGELPVQVDPKEPDRRAPVQPKEAHAYAG